jgi:hypothetical protein
LLRTIFRLYNLPVRVKWDFLSANCYDGLKEDEALSSLCRWQSLEKSPCLKWLTGEEEARIGYPTEKVAGWLYDLVRENVKRDRVFDLAEAFKRGKADCLGYAKLFTLLARALGLQAGVIEVVIDNRGRYIPHTAAMVIHDSQRRQCVDLWYGSKNIEHKRLGLQVKRGRNWEIRDVDLSELSDWEVCFLPDSCINGLTLYIRGNQHLNQQEFAEAIKCYSEAIALYPGNSRFFYNRAVAHENLGDDNKATIDYAQALSDEASLIRILAREHDEVTSLINLDARAIDYQTQAVYLMRKGFLTGKEVPTEHIAKEFGMPKTETADILASIEAKLAGSE